MLTSEQVKEFQRLYKIRFGKEISREEALIQGIKLVQLMKLIYKPITKEDLERLNENEKREKNFNTQKN